MIASIKDNDELRMNAYCDGELDPASAIEFERRLADDVSLKARYDRLLSLRRTALETAVCSGSKMPPNKTIRASATPPTVTIRRSRS